MLLSRAKRLSPAPVFFLRLRNGLQLSVSFMLIKVHYMAYFGNGNFPEFVH